MQTTLNKDGYFMKKIKSTLCILAVLMSAVVLMGCSFVDRTSNDTTTSPIDHTTTSPTDETVPSTNDAVRYTVTEEEWNAWTTFPNYTVEECTDSYRLINKYTEDAIEYENGSIVIIEGDKDYQLIEKGNGYVAYDCTSLELLHDGLLSGGYVYDEFTYDAEIGAYVLDLMDETGEKWEVKFKNGVPVSIIYTEVTVVDGIEKNNVITKSYTNVGTTVINVPEFVYEEEAKIRLTVTEEEWNNNVNAGSFAGEFLTILDYDNFDYYMCSFKYAGNAIELDGKIIVFEGDKKYMLEEVDGAWYATEWNEYDFCSTLIPAGLDFNDYEYSESRNIYIPKEDTGSDMYYSFGFEEGKLLHIDVRKSLNVEDPGYQDMFGFYVSEIGTVTIDVPEYVIVE